MPRKMTEIEVLDEGKDVADLIAGQRCERVQITCDDETSWILHGVQLVAPEQAIASMEVIDGDADAVQVTELDLDFQQWIQDLIDGATE